MKILKNPTVKIVLIVVAVLIGLTFARPYLQKVPVLNTI